MTTMLGSISSQQQLIFIVIEGLYGMDLTEMERVTGQTATVSFSGSIANMQIGTSRLCPVSGYPVIESRPLLSNATTKIAWPTEFSHLKMITTRRPPTIGGRAVQQPPKTTMAGAGWSDAVPEILGITLRIGTAVGMCHLMVEDEEKGSFKVQQSLPVRSKDPALSNATLRIRMIRDGDNDIKDTLPPSLTQSSSQSSLDIPLDLGTLVATFQGLPQQRTSCSSFSFRDFRRAVLACQPILVDDSSTIATHDSWEF